MVVEGCPVTVVDSDLFRLEEVGARCCLVDGPKISRTKNYI